MSTITAIRNRVSNTLVEAVLDNPVVIKELRTRMREWKAFAIMGAYVLFGAIVLLLEYSSEMGRSGSTFAPDRNVGMELFRSLGWAQAVLLTFILPSLTFSSFTQEIERKTIEMLALTRLTPGKIALGKQFAPLLYALILLLSTLPLASLCVMLGGISPGEIALWYLILIAWCFLLTCTGVFWSSLCVRTVASSLLTYGSTVGYFFVTMPTGFIMTMTNQPGGANVPALSGLNPGFAAHISTATTRICGLGVPLWFITVVLHVWVGLLLLLIASTHVKYKFAERALSIRLLLTGLTVGMIWVLIGNITVLQSVQELANLIGLSVGMILGFICLVTCAVSTGVPNPKPGQSFIAYALSWRKAFRSDIGGAIPFVFIWTTVSYAAFVATLAWILPLVNPWTATTSKPFKTLLFTSLPRLYMVLCCVVVATAAVGLLASCCVKSRRNAAALVLLFLILAFSSYGVQLAYYVDGVTKTRGLWWQLAAFWPVAPILAETGEWQGMPKLWWSPEQFWIATSCAYLLIAIASLSLSPKARARYGGVREE